MQLIYLLIAVIAGIAELFTGTFYLAAVALAALLALLAGFLLPELTLHWVFLGASLLFIVGASFLRHRLANRAAGIDDLDLGQRALVLQGPDPQGQYRLQYRGSEWPAILAPECQEGPICPGSSVVIVGRDGNLLHVAPLPPSVSEETCPPLSSS
ncbi:MAG: NfeD family protein [Acidithiobacillus sp.]|nr:NfeD family protein [Acidithiobacillus sp.]